MPARLRRAFNLAPSATLDGRAVEEQATFVLRPEGRELDDVVSRDEVLRQIAAVTGGEFRAGTLGTPAIRPARHVRVGNLRTVAIWSHVERGAPIELILEERDEKTNRVSL